MTGADETKDKEEDVYSTTPDEVGPDLMERPKRARKQVRIGRRQDPPSVPERKRCGRCGEPYFVAYEEDGRRVNLSAEPDPAGHWVITGSQVRHEVNRGEVRTVYEWFVSPGDPDSAESLYRLHKHNGRVK